MEIIRSNGKTKRIPFRSTGASCTNTPAPRGSRSHGAVGAGWPYDRKSPGAAGARSHSAPRQFHCQRPPGRTSCASSAPAPGPQPPRRKGSSARFRRCFLQGCVCFNLLGKGHLGGMGRREGCQQTPRPTRPAGRDPRPRRPEGTGTVTAPPGRAPPAAPASGPGARAALGSRPWRQRPPSWQGRALWLVLVRRKRPRPRLVAGWREGPAGPAGRWGWVLRVVLGLTARLGTGCEAGVTACEKRWQPGRARPSRSHAGLPQRPVFHQHQAPRRQGEGRSREQRGGQEAQTHPLGGEIVRALLGPWGRWPRWPWVVVGVGWLWWGVWDGRGWQQRGPVSPLGQQL